MEYFLRPMIKKDIAQVVEIEQKSFPTPWSSYAFSCELSDNEFACYLVASPCNDSSRVVGYGGMWIIIDEAHITNVAVAPAHRGKGLGKLLLAGLFQSAGAKNARRITLEVRVSNLPAQHLYKQMGFKSVGIRPGYYMDTNEDAMIMWRDLADNQYEVSQ